MFHVQLHQSTKNYSLHSFCFSSHYSMPHNPTSLRSPSLISKRERKRSFWFQSTSCSPGDPVYFFFKYWILLNAEPLAKGLLREGEKTKKIVGYFTSAKMEEKPNPDNGSWARCSPSIKPAVLFKSHLLLCKARNKTFQKMPRKCWSSDSLFFQAWHFACSWASSLEGLTVSNVEANFK